MKLFFDERQLLHRPRQFMVAGRLTTPVEVPERALAMREALAAIGCTPVAPERIGEPAVRGVHAPGYVAFLRSAHEAFHSLPNAGPEVLPNIHPYAGAGPDFAPRPPPRTTSVVGLAGWHVGDLACAIGAGTFEAALASAEAAAAAPQAVLAGDGAAFALCRPPGHHAYADRASGFCFFNNAALVAERLRTRFGRVAIVDFDTHHGDGTQALFYRRADVFVGSVHTDPTAYYPFFVGYADERGAGPGEGCNLNLPLPQGADDAAFVAANLHLAEQVRAFGAEALVISAGWDAHRDDPLSRLQVTSEAYARLGQIWGGLRLPTVIVQEGGYSLAAVAEAAPLFAGAFLAARG